MEKWAAVVAQYLKPSGQFIFVDFHPYVWMFDNHFTKIQYSYFNTETIVESESGTYADKEAPIKTDSIGWNHPISEVLNSLIKHGLTISIFDEFDYSPYNVFPEMEESGKGRFRMKAFSDRLPLVYSILAVKK